MDTYKKQLELYILSTEISLKENKNELDFYLRKIKFVRKQILLSEKSLEIAKEKFKTCD